MKPGFVLAVSLMVVSSLAFTAQAAPPEGKGPGNGASNPGNRGKGGPDINGNRGNGGKAGPGMSGNQAKRPGTGHGMGSKRDDNIGHRYDDRGRHYDYFDDRRGRMRGDHSYGNHVHAGITAALARNYAHDYGLRGYSRLPPGIRKNLVRGKPLPPGIARKRVPRSLLERLPRHSGYEWHIAGTDLVLISLATAVVADILYDVFD
ncbi:anti-virulence regulator CigR family protein [Advenella sp. RU8]|uniref:anti-virulence regulator CigR family protein n=1 Tax=Advenella sp. RU8 TaxID=3399575 RepID=UPI003AAC9859